MVFMVQQTLVIVVVLMMYGSMSLGVEREITGLGIVSGVNSTMILTSIGESPLVPILPSLQAQSVVVFIDILSYQPLQWSHWVRSVTYPSHPSPFISFNQSCGHIIDTKFNPGR
jgi:hypothetical protein